MNMLSNYPGSHKISLRSDPIRRAIAVASIALAALALVLRASGVAGASGATAGPFLTLGIVIGAAVLVDRAGMFAWLAGVIVPSERPLRPRGLRSSLSPRCSAPS